MICDSFSHQGTTRPFQSMKDPESLSVTAESTFKIPLQLSLTVVGTYEIEREQLETPRELLGNLPFPWLTGLTTYSVLSVSRPHEHRDRPCHKLPHNGMHEHVQARRPWHLLSNPRAAHQHHLLLRLLPTFVLYYFIEMFFLF